MIRVIKWNSEEEGEDGRLEGWKIGKLE